MQTSKTFSIHFWLSIAKKKNNLVPIYARITVDGKRAEISLKRFCSVTYWDTRSKKSTLRTAEGKALNIYLDQVYSNWVYDKFPLDYFYKIQGEKYKVKMNN